MQVRFWAATDPGRTREHNEDNFLVDKKLNLFIVADGMGGHAAGEIASSVAVREVRRHIADHREILGQYGKSESVDLRNSVLDLIERAIEGACARIFELAQEKTERRGMGTTLSMMLIAGRRGFIGHVGDSRIYLMRTGSVHQLTEDHSLVNELIKRGRLKPGDVFESPYKNAVTRAVGVYESVEVDTFDFDVLPGDNFLLCSDGLSCYLDNEATRAILSADNVKEVPERFIKLANEAGGKDNITSVVVRLLPDGDDSRNDRMTEVRLKLDTLRAIPLFKYLGYKGLVKVTNTTETHTYASGDLVFEEDTRGEEFFVVLEGDVEISKAGVVLAELGPGGHFGEMAMVDKSPRSATARAKSKVKLIQVNRQAFYDLMRRDPIMSVKLLWSFIQVLNTRLRMTNAELLAARETIDVLRRHQVGGVVAEMPNIDPAVAAVSALPVGVTDELIPGFLFADAEAPRTDPLLRMDTGAGAVTSDDLDQRPGLAYEPTEPPVSPTAPTQELKAIAPGADDEPEPSIPAALRETADDAFADDDFTEASEAGPSEPGDAGDELPLPSLAAPEVLEDRPTVASASPFASSDGGDGDDDGRSTVQLDRGPKRGDTD
jgi:serine/threonine protein phosphatase PrpC/CRP-like cAMP-binding protein